MTWLRISADTFGAGRRALLVDAEPDVTWSAVAAVVAPHTNGAPLLIDGAPAPYDKTVTQVPLRDGARFGAPDAEPLPAAGTLALAVTNGPGAGHLVALPAGVTVVGRNEPLVLGDSDVSRHHLRLAVHPDGTVTVRDGTDEHPSSNGTAVNGTPAPAGRRHKGSDSLTVTAGDVIRAGQSGLSLVEIPQPDAAVRDNGAGGLAYNRPPRHRPDSAAVTIEWPAEPKTSSSTPLDVISIIGPIAIGVTMALLLHRVEFLLFTVLTPVLLIGRWISDHSKNRRNRRRGATDYAAETHAADLQLAAALAAEAAARREAAPHAVTVLLNAAGPTSQLWQRRLTDEDALQVRLGLGSAAAATIAPGRADPIPPLAEVPITIDLRTAGSLGFTGPRHRTRAAARWAVSQLATEHSPEDVRIVLLCADDPEQTRPDWEFTRWLPHTRIEDTGAVTVATTAAAVERHIERLHALVEARATTGPGGPATSGGRSESFAGVYVVVVDGSYDLRLTHDLDSLIVAGPGAGIYFCCLDDTPTRLPGTCRAHTELTDSALATFVNGNSRTSVVADLVDATYAETVARALAPIRDVGHRRVSGGLPQRLLLADIADRSLDDHATIGENWAHHGGRSTKALLGVSSNGPYELDLAQGPHLLIGGITGAGKSQLLITLITSLALANRPDALNFVLIDYKGGSAFRPFEPLPHVVGTVTDLDPQETQRALTSFKAEIDRRKVLLDRLGVSSIAGYWALYDAAAPGADDPLPRLVIVVDEFAKLATDLPGFVEKLVEVATQGRSYGVHLVLATQRPSTSVISADIAANVALRIALRTANDTESQLIMNAPDAARIPVTGYSGRAFVRAGQHEAPTQIQTALTTTSAGRTSGPVVRDWPWSDVDQLPVPATPASAGEDQVDAELARIIAAISAAADASGRAPGRRIWLDPLPAVLPLADLEPVAGALGYGRRDSPASQAQSTAALDLEHGSHLIVGGAPGSGRTTLLRTIAASASALDPDELHLYAVDGGGGLSALEAFPYTGVVTAPHEIDRTARLLARLAGEVDRRRRAFDTVGASTISEYRISIGGARIPRLLLLVDSYEALVNGLTTYNSGNGMEHLTQIVRQGYAAGVVCVLAGDRSLLISRLASMVPDRLVLPLSSASDYQAVNVATKNIPTDPRPGRAITLPGWEEVQVAVVGLNPTGAAQHSALRALAAVAPPRRNSAMIRVDRLPERLEASDAQALPVAAGVDWPLAVGGDDLCRVGFDIGTDGPGFLIGGAPRSGKTTALGGAVLAAAATGWPVVLLSPLQTPLLRTAMSGKVNWLDAGVSPQDLIDAVEAAGKPVLLAVDDAEAIVDSPVGLAIASIIRNARQSGHRVIAGAAFGDTPAVRGFLTDLRGSRSGLLLTPRPALGVALEVGRLPDWACGGAPGRAALIRRGDISVVQIPALTP